jgi:hypothetical protein
MLAKDPDKALTRLARKDLEVLRRAERLRLIDKAVSTIEAALRSGNGGRYGITQVATTEGKIVNFLHKNSPRWWTPRDAVEAGLFPDLFDPNWFALQT